MSDLTPLRAASAAYPDACAKLGTAECVLLLAIRWWVSAFREKEDTLFHVCLGLEKAGAYEAAFPIDSLMDIVARNAARPLTVQCPRCPSLSEDEKHLLQTAALAQSGASALAEKALRTALLSAQGAAVALLPLETIGDLFAEAGLIFRTPLTCAIAKRIGRPSGRTIH